jgi:CheY-like chemotaxis protein
LGLALTQKLAELHGGRVEIWSRLGQGSRFTIVLPLLPATEDNDEAQAVPAPSLLSPVSLELISAPTSSGANNTKAASPVAYRSQLQTSAPTRSNHLLLVEDNAYNAKLMLTYLSKLGYELTWVKNGTEMRQALTRALPALILMDIHLPGEDGLALTQQLKGDDRYRAIPIIAQTAMAMTGDRDLCMEAGTAGYISKPIDLKALAQLIAQYVNSTKD